MLLLPSWTTLVKQAAQYQSISQQVASFHCHRASITRVHRLKYLRTYPTLLVNPDGSTLNIRYHEPRAIIRLPFDITNLSESEKKIQLERRKPRTRVSHHEDDSTATAFDRSKYINLVKKK